MFFGGLQAGVIERVEVDDSCIFQPGIAVAIVTLAAGPRSIELSLADREYRRVISMQVRVYVPLGRSAVLREAENNPWRKRRMAALNPDS